MFNLHGKESDMIFKQYTEYKAVCEILGVPKNEIMTIHQLFQSNLIRGHKDTLGILKKNNIPHNQTNK